VKSTESDVCYFEVDAVFNQEQTSSFRQKQIHLTKSSDRLSTGTLAGLQIPKTVGDRISTIFALLPRKLS